MLKSGLLTTNHIWEFWYSYDDDDDDDDDNDDDDDDDDYYYYSYPFQAFSIDKDSSKQSAKNFS